MAHQKKNKDWEEREELIEKLKSDPILQPYFNDGSFAVTNGSEKASFELDVIFPIKKWLMLMKRIRTIAEDLISFPESGEKGAIIPYESAAIPPPGYILGEDDDGEKFWIDSSSMIQAPPTGDLSDDQISRIKAYKEILKETESASLEKTIEDFRRDGDPESEIQVWEKIARIFDTEVKLRENASPPELELLLSVLLQCSMAGTVQVVSVFPPAKTLPQVRRVLRKWDEEPV